MLGVWMWPESLTRRGTDNVFDACRRAGVTDVYFLTKGLSGATAFLTPLAPAMIDGRDLLREALDAAHRRGMRLHAWFTSASDEKYKEAHPESGLYHYKRGRDRGIVSISDGEYAAFMQSVIGEMLKQYGVDGLHLDYIRYNHLMYGWSEEDQRRYAKEGVDLPHIHELMEKTFCADDPDPEAIFDAFRAGDQDARLLAQARRKAVNTFASALCSAARAQRKDLCLSAALMPEGAYDDLAFSDLHYGQHYADLASLMDAFLPMAYSRAYDKGPEWMGLVARGTLRHGVSTVMGVHAYEGGTGITLARDIASAQSEAGVKGVCLFREGSAVWAFHSDREISLLNPLPGAVTACRITRDGESALLPTPVEPNAQRAFPLPFAPQTIQAYAGDQEVCVFAIPEA